MTELEQRIRVVAEARVWFIYGLCSSTCEVIRYVGYTVEPHARRLQHLSHARMRKRNYPLYDWIRSLEKRDQELRMVILESGTGDSWQSAERSWIAKLQANKLFNLSPGGYAAVIPPASRKQAGEKLKTRIFTAEHRARISAAKTGMLRPDQCERMREVAKQNIGKKMNISAEERQRRRVFAKTQSNLNAKKMWSNMTEEERQRRSEITKAQMKRVWADMSDEERQLRREKISAGRHAALAERKNGKS